MERISIMRDRSLGLLLLAGCWIGLFLGGRDFESRLRLWTRVDDSTPVMEGSAGDDEVVLFLFVANHIMLVRYPASCDHK